MISLDAFQILNNRTHTPIRIQLSGQTLCGSGRFSNVYLCNLKSPMKKQVAVKNIWPQDEMKQIPVDQYPEIQTLGSLYHPGIANMMFYFTRTIEQKNVYAIVLDYLPIEMCKYRSSGKVFDVVDAKVYIYQLFCAVAYLKTKNIVHLDIKPANIILDVENAFLKLSDFGNSMKLEPNQTSLNHYQVTRYYRPPELLFNCDKFSSAIDVWSAACVSYEFYGNQVLFKTSDSNSQIRLLISVLGYPSDEDVKSMKIRRPRVARTEPKGIEKYTSNILDGHVYEMLKSTLVLNPVKRKTAEEILRLPMFDLIRCTPRVKRSNGRTIPDLSKFTIYDHPRPEFEVSTDNRSSSSSDRE